MSRNKVLERAKVTPPTGRSEFDVSCIKNFTALAGYINLVFAQPVLSGTHGRINRSTFTRTADVVSPAFPKVTQHTDFFIVNIKSLWSYWENFKLNINDLKSSQLVQFDAQSVSPVLTIPAYVPSFDFGVTPNAGHTAWVCAPEKVFPDPTTVSASTLARVSAQRNDMIRLCEAAGYGRLVVGTNPGVIQHTSNVQNLFKLAAYQKIYFEHYRNTAYESNDPYAYNLDWVTNNGLSQVGGVIDPTTSAGLYSMQQLCTLRKVNYRNDYFHNLYPSINYVLSSPSGADWSVPNSVVGVGDGLTVSGVRSNVQYPSPYLAQTVSATPGTVRSSVQSIRAMFALDKLMRASAYAPKHVKDQWKAQFGVDIPDDSDMVSKRLGSFQNDIIFQEVTQMAPTASTELGDLGAKGVGSGSASDDIEFYAPYDSIIIGVQYFMPRAIYDAFGVNVWNINRARGDFYSKFFENLGLRPIYAMELDAGGYVRQGALAPNTVIGFSVPNMILKIGIDQNLNEFKMHCEWYEPNSSDTAIQKMVGSNYLRAFTLHNTATSKMIDSGGNISAAYFKVNPEDLEYIFRVQVNGAHVFGNFQFYGQLYVKLLISAPMAVHGQPRL